MQVSIRKSKKLGDGFICACMMLFLTAIPAMGFAQGKLSRLRNVVHADRKPEPSTGHKQSKPSKKERHEDRDHHHDDDHEPRRRSHRGNRGWSSNFFGCIGSGLSVVDSCHHPTVVQVYSPPPVCAPVVTVSPPIIVDPLPVEAAPLVDAPIIEAPVPPGYPHVVVEEPTLVYDPALTQAPVVQSVEECQLGTDWFADWAFRGRAVYGGGVDNLTLAGLGLLVQKPGGIGLDTSVKTWRENSDVAREHLWLGDANLVFEFANHRDVRGRLGVGLNWINDRWGGDVGFNMTAEVDIRLTNRWLLTGQADVGTLGSSDFLHTELSLARRFDRTELMVGFDYYDIGGVDLPGVFGGLQFRF